MTGRDKDATWRSTNTFGWSKARLRHELQGGRPYRTFPPGHTFDWSDPYLWPYFNVETSEISIPAGFVLGAINDAVAVLTGRPPPPKRRSALEGMTIGIEVLDGEVPSLPSPSADAPAGSPAPKNDGPGLGYQAARVDRALDRLEAEGRKLSDSTDAELRRLALEQIPEETGFAPPSRQTLDRVIRRRLAK